MLDKTDKRILSLLQQNASQSTARIADKVGLSQAPCWRRIQQLEEKGYIRQRTALLDRKKLKLNTLVFVQVKLLPDGGMDLKSLGERLATIPRVLECYCMLGEQDFLLKLIVRDIYEYERIHFEVLSKIPGVGDIKSAVALSEVKFTTELPIE